MLQNGDKVQARNSESAEWIKPVRFIGKTESGDFMCESKGESKRFRFCEKLKTKSVKPMDFEDLEKLLEWGVWFKHVSTGVVVKNPTIKQMPTEDRPLVDNSFVDEMLWAVPEDAASGTWARCEVEHDD